MKVNKDTVFNNLGVTTTLKLPRYEGLTDIGDEYGMEGDIVFIRSTQELCFHDGTTWVCLPTTFPVLQNLGNGVPVYTGNAGDFYTLVSTGPELTIVENSGSGEVEFTVNVPSDIPLQNVNNATPGLTYAEVYNGTPNELRSLASLSTELIIQQTGNDITFEFVGQSTSPPLNEVLFNGDSTDGIFGPQNIEVDSSSILSFNGLGDLLNPGVVMQFTDPDDAQIIEKASGTSSLILRKAQPDIGNIEIAEVQVRVMDGCDLLLDRYITDLGQGVLRLPLTRTSVGGPSSPIGTVANAGQGSVVYDDIRQSAFMYVGGIITPPQTSLHPWPPTQSTLPLGSGWMPVLNDVVGNRDDDPFGTGPAPGFGLVRVFPPLLGSLSGQDTNTRVISQLYPGTGINMSYLANGNIEISAAGGGLNLQSLGDGELVLDLTTLPDPSIYTLKGAENQSLGIPVEETVVNDPAFPPVLATDGNIVGVPLNNITQIFVDSGAGNDANTGVSVTSIVQTIDRAFEVARFRNANQQLSILLQGSTPFQITNGTHNWRIGDRGRQSQLVEVVGQLTDVITDTATFNVDSVTNLLTVQSASFINANDVGKSFRVTIPSGGSVVLTLGTYNPSTNAFTVASTDTNVPLATPLDIVVLQRENVIEITRFSSETNIVSDNTPIIFRNIIFDFYTQVPVVFSNLNAVFENCVFRMRNDSANTFSSIRLDNCTWRTPFSKEISTSPFSLRPSNQTGLVFDTNTNPITQFHILTRNSIVDLANSVIRGNNLTSFGNGVSFYAYESQLTMTECCTFQNKNVLIQQHIGSMFLGRNIEFYDSDGLVQSNATVFMNQFRVRYTVQLTVALFIVLGGEIILDGFECEYPDVPLLSMEESKGRVENFSVTQTSFTGNAFPIITMNQSRVDINNGTIPQNQGAFIQAVNSTVFADTLTLNDPRFGGITGDIYEIENCTAQFDNCKTDITNTNVNTIYNAVYSTLRLNNCDITFSTTASTPVNNLVSANYSTVYIAGLQNSTSFGAFPSSVSAFSFIHSNVTLDRFNITGVNPFDGSYLTPWTIIQQSGELTVKDCIVSGFNTGMFDLVNVTAQFTGNTVNNAPFLGNPPSNDTFGIRADACVIDIVDTYISFFQSDASGGFVGYCCFLRSTILNALYNINIAQSITFSNSDIAVYGENSDIRIRALSTDINASLVFQQNRFAFDLYNCKLYLDGENEDLTNNRYILFDRASVSYIRYVNTTLYLSHVGTFPVTSTVGTHFIEGNDGALYIVECTFGDSGDIQNTNTMINVTSTQLEMRNTTFNTNFGTITTYAVESTNCSVLCENNVYNSFSTSGVAMKCNTSIGTIVDAFYTNYNRSLEFVDSTFNINTISSSISSAGTHVFAQNSKLIVEAGTYTSPGTSTEIVFDIDFTDLRVRNILNNTFSNQVINQHEKFIVATNQSTVHMQSVQFNDTNPGTFPFNGPNVFDFTRDTTVSMIACQVLSPSGGTLINMNSGQMYMESCVFSNNTGLVAQLTNCKCRVDQTLFSLNVSCINITNGMLSITNPSQTTGFDQNTNSCIVANSTEMYIDNTNFTNNASANVMVLNSCDVFMTNCRMDENNICFDNAKACNFNLQRCVFARTTQIIMSCVSCKLNIEECSFNTLNIPIFQPFRLNDVSGVFLLCNFNMANLSSTNPILRCQRCDLRFNQNNFQNENTNSQPCIDALHSNILLQDNTTAGSGTPAIPQIRARPNTQITGALTGSSFPLTPGTSLEIIDSAGIGVLYDPSSCNIYDISTGPSTGGVIPNVSILR